MVDYTEPLPAAKIRRLRVAQGLVLLFHITGFVGLAFSNNPEFYLRFTPLTLLLTAGLLFAFEPERDISFWGFCVSVSLLGYAAEVIGVLTASSLGTILTALHLATKYSAFPWLLASTGWCSRTYAAT
jgi:putative membrane protein